MQTIKNVFPIHFRVACPLPKAEKAVTEPLPITAPKKLAIYPAVTDKRNGCEKCGLTGKIRGIPHDLLRRSDSHTAIATRNVAKARETIEKAERAVAYAYPNTSHVRHKPDQELRRSIEEQASALSSKAAVVLTIGKTSAELASKAQALTNTIFAEREQELVRERESARSRIQSGES